MLRSRQQAVLVLGMHRSGTSAFTRVLNLLGLDLPQDLMPAKPKENRNGFWESLELAELHDQALATCDSWWGDWRSVPPQWFASIDCRHFTDRLAAILKRDFANSALFVIKDPRICRLVPLWLQTFAHLEIEPLVLIPVRHPAEVAASLAVRTGFDPLTSNLLWLRHVLDAERYTRGIPRSVVTFDDLMRNWQSTVSKIRQDLHIDWPIDPASVTAGIEAFLSPGDRHHVVHSDSALPSWVATTYRALLSEIEPAEKRWNAECWESLRAELDEAATILHNITPHAERQKATETLKMAEREIEALKATNVALTRDVEVLKIDTAQEVKMLKAAIDTAGRESEMLKAGIDTATREIEMLKAANAAALRQNAALNLQREQLSKEVSAFLNSTSWRITAPVRLIAAFLKHRHHPLKQ
jgi:hypothetical protein